MHTDGRRAAKHPERGGSDNSASPFESVAAGSATSKEVK
jgi:hypothetical protein